MAASALSNGVVLIDQSGAIWFRSPAGPGLYARYLGQRITGTAKLDVPRFWLQAGQGRILVLRPATDSTTDVLEVLVVEAEGEARRDSRAAECGRSVRF